MAVLGSAIIQISADTGRIRKDLGKVKGMFGRMEKNVVKSAATMAKSFAAIFIVGGVGRVFKSLIDSAKEYETALINMGKVTDRTFAQLRADISSIGPELGSATDLMKGYYQVISAGVTKPRKALQLLTAASRAAKVSHVEQAEVVKGLTAIMAGFAGKLKDATVAADLLLGIEKGAKATFGELIPVVGGLAQLANDLNISYNEMGGALATVSMTSGDVTEATTRLKALFIALIKPSDEMTKSLGLLRKRFKEMGEASVNELIRVVGFTKAMRLLEKSFEGSDIAMGKTIGRQRAIISFSALAANNFETLVEKIDIVTDGVGLQAEAWEKYEKTFEGAMHKFQATMENVRKDFGTLFLPALTRGFNRISTAIKFMNDQIENTQIRMMRVDIQQLQDVIDNNGKGWCNKALPDE